MNKSRMKILAYIAGIIDGEGHIGIAKQNHPNTARARRPDYLARVVVKMTDGNAVDFLYGNFGGYVGIRPATPPRAIQYYWAISCKKAVDMLKQILPFLIVKKRQAELAIRFQAHRKQGKLRNLEFDEWCFNEMKRYHSEHYSSKAAAESKRSGAEMPSCAPNL